LQKLKINAILIFALILINPISYVHHSDLFAQTSGSYKEYSETGIASWYGPGFNGRKTASGERFNTNELTAAHKTIPFNTLLKVTNLENGKFTVVRVNDRGPYAFGRIIDLSFAAKKELEMGGLARVQIEIFSPDSININENLAENPVESNLFEDVIPSKARIFVEYSKEISESTDLTQGNFKEVLSTFKRVKIIVVGDNSENAPLTLKSLENSRVGKKYYELRDLKSILSGYTLEIKNIDNQVNVSKLIGKLDSANLNTVFLFEFVENETTNLKILIGNYDNIDESLFDRNTLEDMGFEVGLVKI
jgi:rare lipoprotein A